MNVNVTTGIGMFCLSFLIISLLWLVGANAWWIVSMVAFGGCGLLLILFDWVLQEKQNG